SGASGPRPQKLAANGGGAAVSPQRIQKKGHPCSFRQETYRALQDQTEESLPARGRCYLARRPVSFSQGCTLISSYRNGGPPRVQRRGALHHGHLGFYGHHEKIFGAELL